MKILFIIFLQLLTFVNSDHIALKREVNLDLPPEERWTDIVTEFKEPLKETLNWINNKSWLFTPIIKRLKQNLKEKGGWSDENIKEMKGISKISDIDYSIIETANLFFEWNPGCTSIVSNTISDGVIHGRNFDMNVKGLSNITLQLNFVKQGKVVYTGTGFVGYVGLINAMKPYKFSITANSRFQGDHFGKLNLFENINAAKKGGKPIGTFIRDIVEESNSYKQIINKLNSSILIDVAYYIIAGVNKDEGCVITRNRYNIDSSKGFDNGIWNIGKLNWWRLQTNFDHWWWSFDKRRDIGNNIMRGIGIQDISINNIKHLLNTEPILAKTTVFTSLMNPNKNYYYTLIRN